MSRKLRVILITLILISGLFFSKLSRAVGTITFPADAVTISDNSIGATANYTLKFTPETNVSSGGSVLIRFIFPQGVTFGLAGISVGGATSPEISAAVDAASAQSSQTVVLGVTDPLNGGTQYTIVINNVINPGNPGMGILAVATKNSSGTYLDGNIEASTPSTLSPSFQIGNGAFKGRVTNPSGNAIADAWVNIFPATPGSSAPPQGMTTNYNGDYLISTTNVTADTDYFLEVFPPFSGVGNMIAPDRATAQWNGSSATTQNFEFQTATKTISGTVTYRDTGGGVSGASIGAFKMNGSGWAQTTTDSNGEYTLLVGGGNWGVMPQQNSDSGWSYGDKPGEVTFTTDTAVQSKTLDFIVDRASATITGRLVKPGGTPVDPNTDGIGGLGVWSQEGRGGSAPLNSNGTFSIGVPAGTYNLYIWAPPSSAYGAPSIAPATVKDNETLNLGDITLSQKDATITGSVKVEGTNDPVSGARVNAFVRDGGGFSEATTNSEGNFTLNVSAGRWMVMPFFDTTASYALNQQPQEVSVSSGGTAGPLNFTVKTASSTINGTVVDGSGNPVSVYGYAFAETGGAMFGPGGLGGPIERGSFSFKVPADTYVVKVGLAPGSGYTPGDGTSVTVADSATANITVTLKTNDATITGSIVDDNGDAVASSVTSQMFVFAVSGGDKGHSFQQGTISGSSYSINVAAGEWSLGYFLNPSSGYMSAPPDQSMKISVNSGGNATKNITLKAANATVTGTVYQPGGTTPATGVFVSVDNRETEGQDFFNGAPTDTNGNYTIRITSGTYKVRANVAPNSGYLSPTEQTVAVAANDTQTVNFTLRQADATISGDVTLNGSGVPSFVSAWAEDGGFAQSMAGSSGSYSLSVSKGTIWHVAAHYENGTTPYESNETTVNMTGATATANLTLSEASYTLPQALTLTFDSTEPKLISLTDGTEINIPASALATSGNVTLTINPKASLPTKKGDKPLWYGYEFTATDSNGQTITNFNSSITITFPYTDAQLARLGITADDLVPSYWDETSGTWKKVSNVSINTTTKTVTISIDHFTDFALTANATTSTSSSSSTSTSDSNLAGSGPSVPDFYANQGGTINRGDFTAIVESGTSPWDSYLWVETIAKKNPQKVGNYWQVGPIYNAWLRASFNHARILYPAKPSIIAIHYSRELLEGFPEKALKLAYSGNEGKTWQILSTSILDQANKSIAAIHNLDGYFMLVSGYGNYYGDAVTTLVPYDEKVYAPTPPKKPTRAAKNSASENNSPESEINLPKPGLIQTILNFFRKVF